MSHFCQTVLTIAGKELKSIYIKNYAVLEMFTFSYSRIFFTALLQPNLPITYPSPTSTSCVTLQSSPSSLVRVFLASVLAFLYTLTSFLDNLHKISHRNATSMNVYQRSGPEGTPINQHAYTCVVVINVCISHSIHLL